MNEETTKRAAALFEELRLLAPADRERRLSSLEAESPTLAAAVRALWLARGATIEGAAGALRPGAEAVPDAAGPAPGDRLGPYEIVAPIGAGGMGVVYSARDTRLERMVALKVLPPREATSPDRRARFEREARAVAQLQHPNICTLFDVGSDGGRDYLVMEHLQGEPLSDRLERGPLPIAQVLDYGAAIAEALVAAHRRGILHRDLKPGNVMLTRSGPKLLDFGLAKLFAGGDESVVGPAPVAGPSHATVLSLTGEETIVGTPSYMAPEQIERGPLDARTDLWALGCVLYEMATGQVAFPGRSPASIIAAVLEREPRPLVELCPVAPPALDRLVRACLAKDPDARWQNAADLRRELLWIAEGGEGARAPASPRGGALRRAAILVAALAAASIGAFLAGRAGRPEATPARSVRAVLPLTGGALDPFDAAPEISPDGRRVVVGSWYGRWGEPLRLLSLESDEARPLVGTEGATFPFWSPDSRSLGYFAERKLYRLDLDGGSPTVLAKLDDDARGGSWGADGTIVFSPGRKGGLMRIAASGGVATGAAPLDAGRQEVSHRLPQFLPDGRRFLYWTIAGGGETPVRHAIRLGSLDGGEPAVVLEDVLYGYVSSGHLLYRNFDNQGILARPFDLERGVVAGDERAVVSEGFGGATVSLNHFSLSREGTLVYLGTPSTWRTELAWFDRDGQRTGSAWEPDTFSEPRLSPDGRRLVVGITDPESWDSHLWVLDLATGARRRLTLEPGIAGGAAWSPDGRRIAYGYEPPAEGRGAPAGLYVRDADGGGEAERLFETPWVDDRSLDWSPDGRRLVFNYWNLAEGNYDLWLYDFESRRASPWLAGRDDERDARFSLDGRHAAYVSNESGRREVYLRRIDGDERWQLTSAGGQLPRFAPGGGTLFYIGRDARLHALDLELGSAVRLGSSRVVLERRLPVTLKFFLEVAPDGRSFLIDAPPPDAMNPPVRVVLNWPTLLRR